QPVLMLMILIFVTAKNEFVCYLKVNSKLSISKKVARKGQPYVIHHNRQKLRIYEYSKVPFLIKSSVTTT
ncbi:MAG: hypothetical protein R3209_04285, partial [Salinimicrobium sediminis]|nr:hypothetical protein [Salinimicrobium sediminis]